jgi:hypothetical protein
MGFILATFAEINGPYFNYVYRDKWAFIMIMFAEINGLYFGYVCRDKWALFWPLLQR